MLRDSLARRSLAVVLLLAAGCGGSGEDTVTLSITSTAAVDGFVTNTGTVFAASPVGIIVGDNGSNETARGALRFPLSSIPAGAVVRSATLVVHQSVVMGAPHVTLGTIVVDHVDLGAALDAGDYGSPAFAAGLGVLSSDATLGARAVDVTAQLLADLVAARATSDFRLRFTTDTDANSQNDVVHLDDAEDALGVGLLPTLVVVREP